jgi:peptide chain release factor 1
MDFSKLKKEYEELQKELSNPELVLDRTKYAECSKRIVFLSEVLEKVTQLEAIEKNIEESHEMLEKEKDEELKKMASEEIEALNINKKVLIKELSNLLEPKKEESNEVLIEIRAGAGGEEASLFARDLFEMYQKYAQKNGWSSNVLENNLTDLGGFKEVSFTIKGSGVESHLKYESGVHRVQRIPETEKAGRIHTSTVSVVVLPKPKETDIEIKSQDIRVDVYRASGPGGQYVNRRESAVRITHIPTGIVTTSQTARTQNANRENALSVLKVRIFDMQKEEEEKKMGKERKEKVGRSMRAEKIRTYNFPQDRITDHRIKKSWGNIENILQGNLDNMIKSLKEGFGD